MGRLIILLRCSHPLPVAAVSAATTVLAVSVGIGGRWPLVLATVLGNQLSIGLINDYVDRDADRRAGRGDKPLAAGETSPGVVLAVAVAAGLLAIALSLALGLAAAGAQLVMLAVAQAYNLGLKRTIFSVAPYAVAFGMVPLFVALALGRQEFAPPCHLAPHVPGGPIFACPTPAISGLRWPQWWAVVAAALLGAGAHFTQSLPDIESDREQGRGGLPAALGPGRALAVAAGCLFAAAALLIAGPGRGAPTPALASAGLTVVLTAGVVTVGLSGRRRLAFRLNVGAAGLLIAGLVLTGQSILVPPPGNMVPVEGQT